MNTRMNSTMFTLLLTNGCHYITGEDASRVALAVREGREYVDIIAHVSAMRGAKHPAQIATMSVLKLIAHDVAVGEVPAPARLLSDYRARRSGRSGPSMPRSVR